MGKIILAHLFQFAKIFSLYHTVCTYVCAYKIEIEDNYHRTGWPSGLRRWFKAPVTLVAWVRIPLLSFLFHHFLSFLLLLFLTMHAYEHTIKGKGKANLFWLHFLNQARAGRRPARAWFHKIDPVRTSVCVCVCVCVCPPPRPLITSGVMWCDIDPRRLVKQVL